MQNHMHLARIPQGPERDYVRGLLRFMYKDGRKFMGFMYFVQWVIVAVLFYACGLGVHRISIGELPVAGYIGVLCLALFAGLCVWMLVSVAKQFKRENEIKEFNNIQVWDVQVVDVMITQGKRLVYFAKLMFADGTVGTSQYKMDMYSIHNYTYGLLVAVYNDRGEIVQRKLIPRMEYGTKPYKLAMRGL